MVSDIEAIEQVRHGHAEAFGVLVERYLRLVHSFAYAQVGSHEEAEDIAQETFLAAYRGIHKLREPGKLTAWLIGIARHVASASRRRKRREVRLDTTPEAPVAVTPDMARHELRALVRDHVAQLESQDREALVLHYFSGLRIREVADALQITPEAAAKRIQRAREALGERLLNELGLVSEPARSEDERKRAIMLAVLALPTPTGFRLRPLEVFKSSAGLRMGALLVALSLAGGWTIYTYTRPAPVEPAVRPTPAPPRVQTPRAPQPIVGKTQQAAVYPIRITVTNLRNPTGAWCAAVLGEGFPEKMGTPQLARTVEERAVSVGRFDTAGASELQVSQAGNFTIYVFEPLSIGKDGTTWRFTSQAVQVGGAQPARIELALP